MLIESAHSILAGLDPSDDMAYALWHKKLWSVHLNDQNGLKYDQDKVFGSVDLRRAFNQVWVLERGGFTGCVGLDVKPMRTTRAADQTRHLANSTLAGSWSRPLRIVAFTPVFNDMHWRRFVAWLLPHS